MSLQQQLQQSSQLFAAAAAATETSGSYQSSQQQAAPPQPLPSKSPQTAPIDMHQIKTEPSDVAKVTNPISTSSTMMSTTATMPSASSTAINDNLQLHRNASDPIPQ